MSDVLGFLTDFIDSSFSLVQFDILSLAFWVFIFLSALGFIFYVVWGKSL